MNIDLRHCNHDHGAYGLVAFTNDGKAIKIFSKAHSKEQAINVFESECSAYNKALKCESLKSLVPQFHGKIIVESIINQSGIDITKDYFTELSYSMEFVDGKFRKLGEIDSLEAQRVSQLFSDHGINYTRDSSAVLDSNGSVFKLIDFALEYFEVWH
ncbi:hypothetical protein ABVY78_004686 [Vibrio parahaemolyticus]